MGVEELLLCYWNCGLLLYFQEIMNSPDRVIHYPGFGELQLWRYTLNNTSNENENGEMIWDWGKLSESVRAHGGLQFTSSLTLSFAWG